MFSRILTNTREDWLAPTANPDSSTLKMRSGEYSFSINSSVTAANYLVTTSRFTPLCLALSICRVYMLAISSCRSRKRCDQFLPRGRRGGGGVFETTRERRISSAISTRRAGDAGNPVRVNRVIYRTSVRSSAYERDCCDSRAVLRKFRPDIRYCNVW